MLRTQSIRRRLPSVPLPMMPIVMSSVTQIWTGARETMRLAFYYPWFPRNWTQQGIYPYTNFTPSLNYYDSANLDIIKKHIAAMQYAKIEGGIASWWGQGSEEDRNFSKLLTLAEGTTFKWCIYHELESKAKQPVNQIESDLKYVQANYTQHPNYLRVDGRFVVFVYSLIDNEKDGRDMASRWKQANTVNAFIVLKVFPQYRRCPDKPDSWHQYAPAQPTQNHKPYSFTISPGFWKRGEPSPILERNTEHWRQSIRDMGASKVMFELITTFNEHGEGTGVENCKEWETESGCGEYLDALHSDGKK